MPRAVGPGYDSRLSYLDFHTNQFLPTALRACDRHDLCGWRFRPTSPPSVGRLCRQYGGHDGSLPLLALRSLTRTAFEVAFVCNNLCTTPRKAYGGVDVHSHVFMTSALLGAEWSGFMSRPRYRRGTRHPLDWRLGGSHS
jgi:hypothetical protein